MNLRQLANFCMLTFSSSYFSFANASPIDVDFFTPIDAKGTGSGLVLNPSIAIPKSTQLSAVVLSRSVKYTVLSDVSDTKTDLTESAIGAGFGFGLGGGSGLSLAAVMRDQKIDEKSLTTSAVEKFKKTEVSGRFGFKIVDGLRIGAMFRYHGIARDLTATGQGDAAADGNYSGTLTALGGGLSFMSTDFSFGAAYQLPLQGKITVAGESLLTMEPGYVLAHAQYKASGQLSLGISGTRHRFAKDERAGLDLRPDASIHCYEEYSGGAEYKITESFLVRPMVSVQKFIASGDENPQKALEDGFATTSSANRFKLLGLIQKQDLLVGFGGIYNKKTFGEAGGSAEMTFEALEQTYLAYLTIQF